MAVLATAIASSAHSSESEATRRYTSTGLPLALLPLALPLVWEPANSAEAEAATADDDTEEDEDDAEERFVTDPLAAVSSSICVSKRIKSASSNASLLLLLLLPLLMRGLPLPLAPIITLPPVLSDGGAEARSDDETKVGDEAADE